jgi:hypothetical protein
VGAILADKLLRVSQRNTRLLIQVANKNTEQ